MKQFIAILIMLLAALDMTAQQTVTGQVTDGREPLAGANVYIWYNRRLPDRFARAVLFQDLPDRRGNAESLVYRF